MRVFSFAGLDLAEVNAKDAYDHFVTGPEHKMMSKAKFRKEIARGLIYNKWILAEDRVDRRRSGGDDETSSAKKPRVDCAIKSVEKFKSWRDGVWVNVKKEWQQRHCGGCHKKVITYCVCNPSKALCVGCFPEHMQVKFTE